MIELVIFEIFSFVERTRDGTDQDFLDPTGKFQNHRPVDRFFTEGFCSLFNVSNEKFSKEGGGAWVRC